MEGFSKERLKRIRLQLGLSQRDVPGVAQDTVSALESGRREPRPSTLKRLATAYGVEVRDFFEESVTPPKTSPLAAFDIDEIIREILEADHPADPAELRILIDERTTSRLEGLPKETLEMLRDRLITRKRQLNEPRTLEDLMANPEREAALDKAWGELRAVRLAIAALDRELAEV